MMNNVPGLADSGVKFFDQGALFQINALINIREGVKKLSNELNEVLKEKKTLETTVTQLKAENETLNKLLKSKYLEERGPISLNSCLIVTEKFVQSLSNIADKETDVITSHESDAVKDLISKVHEAFKKGEKTNISKMAVKRPGLTSTAGSNTRQEENETIQQCENCMSTVRDTEMLPATNPTAPLPHLYEDIRLDISRKEVENVTSQGPLLSKSLTDHSNTADSSEPPGATALGCDLCGHSMTEIEEIQDVDISRVKTEPEPYAEQKCPVDVCPTADEQLSSIPHHPQPSTSVEETFLPSLSELDQTARHPIETEMPVYVLSSPVDDPIPGPAELMQPELLTRANTPTNTRPSKRGMEWKRGPPFTLKKGFNAATTLTSSISAAAKTPGGAKGMLPRSKSTLYFNPRTSMIGNKSSIGHTSMTSISGTTKGTGSRPIEGKHAYQCDLCNKRFTQSHTLQAHIRIHTGEKPFKCSICEKSFSDRANFRRHQLTHSNEKPHKCSLCPKAFSQRYCLRKHEKWHCSSEAKSYGFYGSQTLQQMTNIEDRRGRAGYDLS